MRRRNGPVLALGFTLITSPGILRGVASPVAAPPASCAVDPQLPSFEVAAITPVAEKDRGYTEIGQYGLPSFHMHNASLKLLINFSFDVPGDNILNAPHGLDDAVFNLDVKSEDGTPLSYEALKPRMQQLLKQRFCLKATPGTKQISGYDLVLTKGGTTLKPTGPSKERGSAYITQHEVSGTNLDMTAFAAMLRSPAGKPVQNATGLQGSYNVKVKFSSVADEESTLPSIFTAIKEQLGLELKPAQVSVPTLTIESLNLSPSEN